MAGFSIVELLVGMALTGILLGGVVAIFVGSRTSYATADRAAQIQQIGRTALDQLTRDIRAAGFTGCARSQQVATSTLADGDEIAWNVLDTPVRGYQFIGPTRWSPTLDPSNAPYIGVGSDVLILRGPKRNAATIRLRQTMLEEGDDLQAPPAALVGWVEGDTVLAHSCEARSYFVATAIADGVIAHSQRAPSGSSPGNATANLGYIFGTDAELTPIQTAMYYVGPSSQSARTASSLWRRINADTPVEIARGVEEMQLQFGVDVTGDAVIDDYVTADSVQDWRAVRSVAVALLVHSAETATDTPQNAPGRLLDVESPHTEDGRMRESFTTIATLRNASLAR